VEGFDFHVLIATALGLRGVFVSSSLLHLVDGRTGRGERERERERGRKVSIAIRSVQLVRSCEARSEEEASQRLREDGRRDTPFGHHYAVSASLSLHSASAARRHTSIHQSSTLHEHRGHRIETSSSSAEQVVDRLVSAC
jgi:hypothetical protein